MDNEQSMTHDVRRLLVAEDEIILLLNIKLQLEPQGYLISRARNGLEVIELVKQEDYDCIIMDVKMPELDGIECTRRIRAGEVVNCHPRIPVIGLTGYMDEDMRRRCLDVGMDLVLAKPLDPDRLIHALDNLQIPND